MAERVSPGVEAGRCSLQRRNARRWRAGGIIRVVSRVHCWLGCWFGRWPFAAAPPTTCKCDTAERENEE